MGKTNIHFHIENVDFEFTNEKIFANWINKTILKEGKQLRELNYIFCSDEYLLKINQEHLNHDTYTDIVTFNYVEGSTISGDLFISLERVRDNANHFSTSFEKELKRVMIHGVLHLIGYNDKTEEETIEIRAKEDFYMKLFSEEK